MKRLFQGAMMIALVLTMAIGLVACVSKDKDEDKKTNDDYSLANGTYIYEDSNAVMKSMFEPITIVVADGKISVNDYQTLDSNRPIQNVAYTVTDNGLLKLNSSTEWIIVENSSAKQDLTLKSINGKVELTTSALIKSSGKTTYVTAIYKKQVVEQLMADSTYTLSKMLVSGTTEMDDLAYLKGNATTSQRASWQLKFENNNQVKSSYFATEEDATAGTMTWRDAMTYTKSENTLSIAGQSTTITIVDSNTITMVMLGTTFTYTKNV
jgi:hypothetical protein